MNKKLLILLVLFFNVYLFQAQCAYPSATPPVGTYTFCVDGATPVITANVRAGQYALLNIVRGFKYTFSVGNINNGGETENLTLFDVNDAVIGFISNKNGASVDYTAQFSGQIKILFSRGQCINSGGDSGLISLRLISVGNTLDSQTAFGTGNWIGHVYDWTGIAPPGGASPTSPSTTDPFTNFNYVGYYDVATENINENFGGDNVCFPVLSNGVNRTNINTQTFAVRYRMRSTKAGCFLMNVNGDDGVRVYIDGVMVFNRWVEQSPTAYCNILVNLTAGSDIILDYYENGGQNIVGFTLTPFDGSGNAITSPSNVNVCSNTASNIIATDFSTCTGGNNGGTNSRYQWQSSSDNVNFADISGATERNYTAPAVVVASGGSNNVRYFRRVFRPSTLTAGTCEFFSNVVTVTTSGARPNAPGAIIGSSTQCTNTTATYSIAAVSNAVSYNWSTTATGWIISPASNGLSVSIAFSASATAGNLIVSASNGCGQSSGSATTNIQVRQLPSSASISGSTSVCVGAPAVPITFTNPQNYGVRVTYNINGGSNFVQFVGANTSINFVTAPTNNPGVFVYNLISVGNEIDFPSCSTPLSGNATVTVNSASTSPTAITGSTNICAGGSTLLTVSGGNLGVGATANWFTASCGGTLVGTGNTITVSPTTTTMYFVRYQGDCNTTTCISTTVTVNPIIGTNTISANQTICSGAVPAALAGSLPTGGGGAFVYLWESSTSSASTGFSTATGTNNAQNYIPGSITTNTWYRRTVTSGTCVNVSPTILISIGTAPTISGAVIDATCSSGTNGSITLINPDSSLSFRNADSDFIDLGNAFSLSNRGAFTVEGWVKFNKSDIGTRFSLFGQNDVIEFGFSNNNTIFLWTAGGGELTTPLTAAFGNNAWHHIAAVGTGTSLIIYIDGVAIATGGSSTSNYGSSTFTPKIGAGVIDPSGGGFTGQIRKVGMYSTPLSPAVIATLAGAPTTYTGIETGLLGGYNFSEGMGSTLARLPAGVNGTFQNTPEWNNTYSWKKIGTPSYTALTRNIASLSPGTYTVDIKALGENCSYSQSFIVRDSTPTAPIPSNIIQTTCTQLTGSVTLSGLPSGNWSITANPTTTGLTGLTGSSATSIITGLTANTTYTFTVSNGICSSLPSSAAVLNSVITTTYNGTAWDNGIGLDKIGIINPPTAASITISSDVELCSCTVNAGKNLEIASGITLKLQDRLTVSATGSLTFNDEASLVQINNVVNNSGAINYVRVKDNAVRVTDYTYYSSPVSPLNLAGTGGIAYNPTSHAGSRFFSWKVNSTSGFWQAATASTPMEIGKGYIVRGPNTVPGTPFALLQATFTGVPNNGTITLPDNIIANNFYLLGNPYPSALDADAFLAANNSVLNGTIYFWTHATEISNSGSGFLQYSSNDYAAYNGTGSIATRGNLVNNAQVESNKPNGKIAAGQGFFASSRAVPSASKIIFNNTMRVGVGGITGTNSQFFRTSKTNSKTTTGIEKNRIWLNLTNSGGAFKQLLVGYITGATNEYDSSFDGTTYNGNAYIDFYSLAADKNLTIQGRALPFSDSDLVPLGYVSKLAGEFSIAIDEVDGVLKSQDVFIEDKMLATVHDLKVAPYKFNTAIGTFSDRFVLRYTNRTLSTENFDIADSSIIVSKDRNELKVKSQIETIQRITIFNLLGKKVLDQNGINSTEFRSSNSNLTNQTAIVKITLTTGIVITKKVAF
ncbi:MAG: LamG domain-containing protein [Flavobacterium micromati]|nr:LamG domain-containing protein [Flavobacterium micromati]